LGRYNDADNPVMQAVIVALECHTDIVLIDLPRPAP